MSDNFSKYSELYAWKAQLAKYIPDIENIPEMSATLDDVSDTLDAVSSAIQLPVEGNEGNTAYVHNSKYIPVKPTEELYSGTFNSSSEPVSVPTHHYSALIVAGRAGGTSSTSANITVAVPMVNLIGATNPIKYGLCDDTNHFYFTLSAPDENGNITMTYSAGSDTTNGRVTRIYGLY